MPSAKKKPAAKKTPAKKQTAARRTAKRAPAKASARAKASAKPKRGATAKSAAKASAKPAAKATKKRAAKPRAASNSRPKKKAAAFDKAFLDAQRKKLDEERTELLHQADVLRAEAEELAENMEPGDVQFDEESGEGATIAVERLQDLALSAQARAQVEEIDAALIKIDDGSYGLCEMCGNKIPKERLRFIPHASLCVSCKSSGFAAR